MLLEEGLNDLLVKTVVHVWVELKGRGLQLLISETTVVHELQVLLIVVLQSGDLATFPVQVTHVCSAMKGH